MAPPGPIDVRSEYYGALSVPRPKTQAKRLTIEDIAAQRAQAAPIPTGVASVGNSEQFKSHRDSKPLAKSWEHLFNEEAKARQPSSLKGAIKKYFALPGLISLGGGIPASENFPLDALSIHVPQPPDFEPATPPELSNPTAAVAAKHDVAEGASDYDLHVALNYGQGTGAPPLVRFVTEHTELVHDPPYRDWTCILTAGNTFGIDAALRMLSSPGDCLLVEAYAYSSALEAATPMGVRCIGVDVDDEGLLPAHMDEILCAWTPSERNGAPKPRLLYTVPTGQNPTGATQGLERRRELYAVAQKHDLFIIEDDPYYYLQMDPYRPTPAAPPAGHPATVAAPNPPHHAADARDDAAACDDFLGALLPSLLALDTDGRVLRLDSFSKVVFPVSPFRSYHAFAPPLMCPVSDRASQGARCGWLTGPAPLLARAILHTETSVQSPSGLSQLVLYKLLDETWGHAGYVRWLARLRRRYAERRDGMLAACERFLPKGVASWSAPAAGMFVRCPNRPCIRRTAVEYTADHRRRRRSGSRSTSSSTPRTAVARRPSRPPPSPPAAPSRSPRKRRRRGRSAPSTWRRRCTRRRWSSGCW